MKNILKFGLMSAVTAVALAQTPAADYMQGMDEDILAIASRGALSDSMQGFRKLADDEAGSIFGGLMLNYPIAYGLSDNFGNPQRLVYYQEIAFAPGEEGSGYATLNGVTNKRNHANFSTENRPINGATLHFKIVKFANSQETMNIVKYNPYTKREYSVYEGTPILQAIRQGNLGRAAYQNYAEVRQYFFGR